jgi:hypothetical protein
MYLPDYIERKKPRCQDGILLFQETYEPSTGRNPVQFDLFDVEINDRVPGGPDSLYNGVIPRERSDRYPVAAP